MSTYIAFGSMTAGLLATALLVVTAAKDLASAVVVKATPPALAVSAAAKA